MFDKIYEKLESKVGGRMVMTPGEFASIVGISTGQQANLRSEDRFPIPHKKMGGKVQYSTHEVAKYIAGSATAHAKGAIKVMVQDKPLKRLEKKKQTKHLEAGWWASFSNQLDALFQYEALAIGQHRAKMKWL